MSIAVSVFGVFFALFLLIVLTYKGLHLSWVSIIAALVIMITSGIAIGQGWDDNIANGIGTMAGTLIPLFVAGATFGKIISATGAADSFAKFLLGFSKNWSDAARRIYGAFLVILVGVIMVFAGVDNFAVLFTEIAIAASIMSEVNIPRRFMCALLIVGSSAGGVLPGTPSVTNIFAAQYLGTTATCAPILTTVGSVFIICGALFGLSKMWEKDVKKGLCFEYGPLTQARFDEEHLPPWFFMLIPVVAVFVCYNVLSMSAFFALLVAVAISAVILFPYLPYDAEKSKNKFTGKLESLMNDFNGGVELAGIPAIILINMALGNLLSATPAFEWFVSIFSNVSGSPILLFAIISIIIIGVSASMSGMIVMFNLAAALFIPVLGLAPEVAHRLVAFSGLVLDTMPFGTMVVSILLLTGVKQKEGYPPVFFSTVGVTFVACMLVCVLAMLGVR